MKNYGRGPNSQQKLNRARRRKVLGIVVFAALLCGGTTANKAAGQGTLVFSPTATSGVAANTLTTTPTSGPFGSVPVGTTKSQTVELKNSGPASVTISSATVSGKGFALHGITTPLVLAGGKTVSITLSYAPTALGYVAGSISIVSNAANKTLTMAVSGTGVTAPRITTSPANHTVTAGQTATFTVVAAGTAPLSYQWQKNGVNISGATAASYTTPVTTTSESGSRFAVVVKNTAGTVTSAAATLTVKAVAPRITTSPANHTVTAGQTATFTVVAAGTAPLSYQWQKNGVNISGATAASYTTPVTTTSESGSRFAVVVKNTAGTVTSAAATLTVKAVAPRITTSPANHTVTAGQTATFTVVAAGTAPLSYQWQKNGVNISGATAASYTTPVTTTSESGSRFAVVVKNTAGTVTSAAATLTVNAVAPRITTSPANHTVTAGQTATFTVVAAGTAPLSYQWQKNGVNIAGATAASYTTPVTTTSESGSRFAVVVKNTAGTVTSAAATLTVNAVAPRITTSPANHTVTAGQTATFTVVAAGTAPLSYQWQKNGVNISRSHRSELHHAGDNHVGKWIEVRRGGEKHGRDGDQCGRDADSESCRAQDHNLTGESYGDGGTDSDLHGGCGRDSTAQLPVAEERREHRRGHRSELHHAGDNHVGKWIEVYRGGEKHGRDSDQCGRDADAVNAVAPRITTSPANHTVTAGQTATFTVVAAGTAPLSYQWQKNGVNISRGHRSELHHAGDNHVGQWIEVYRGGEKHGGDSDQRSCDADGECCRAHDHNLTDESYGDSGTDSDLHGDCGRDSTAQLPVAEKRREHRRSNGSELHHAGDNHVGQWIEVYRGGEEHGGDSDQRSCDADGECCRAHDHNLTDESYGDSGTDSDLHGDCGRDSTAQLPVAEKRREHRRSNGSELHHAGDNHVGQWIEVYRGGEKHGGDSDQRGCDADGECCLGGRYPGEF